MPTFLFEETCAATRCTAVEKMKNDIKEIKTALTPNLMACHKGFISIHWHCKSVKQNARAQIDLYVRIMKGQAITLINVRKNPEKITLGELCHIFGYTEDLLSETN